jgi:hypothetical protein
MNFMYDHEEAERINKRRLEREARMVKFEIHYVAVSYQGDRYEYREVVKALSPRKAIQQLRKKEPTATVFSCRDSSGRLARLSFKTMNPQFSKSAHAEHHRSIEDRLDLLEQRLGGLRYRAAPTYENVGSKYDPQRYDPERDAKNRDAKALIDGMSNKVNAMVAHEFRARGYR